MNIPPAFLKRFKSAKENFKVGVCLQIDTLFGTFLDELQSASSQGEASARPPSRASTSAQGNEARPKQTNGHQNGHPNDQQNGHRQKGDDAHLSMNGHEQPEEEETINYGAQATSRIGCLRTVNHTNNVKRELPDVMEELFDVNFNETEDIICDCEDCIGDDGQNVPNDDVDDHNNNGVDRFAVDDRYVVDSQGYYEQQNGEYEDEYESEEAEEVECKVDPHLLEQYMEVQTNSESESGRPRRWAALNNPNLNLAHSNSTNKQQNNRKSAPVPQQLSAKKAAPTVRRITLPNRSSPSTSGLITRRHLCQYCGKAFPTQQRCLVHEKIHTGDRQFECLFPNCNYEAIQNAHIIRHIRMVHFKLPETQKKQLELGIQDYRDPKEFVGIKGAKEGETK